MGNDKKILILVPAVSARGGISNYYSVLKKHFSSDVEYFERGARTWPVRKGFFRELIRAWKDLKRFKKRIRKGDIGLVQSSTSLSVSTTLRDGLFLKSAQRRGLKTIAFFRGWDDGQQNKISRHFLKLFRYFFFDSDLIIVLSKKVKDQISNWGYKKMIITETTLVDKELLEGYTLKKVQNKYRNLKDNSQIKLLFLSRVEKRKGIYELIEAIRMLNNARYNAELVICGDGFELQRVRDIVERDRLHNIVVKGFVTGKEKKTELENAHLFVFPSYQEGMPNAVLEAMGFGLPVITTPVGGLIDFFQNKSHGLIINSHDANDIFQKISYLSENKIVLSKIAEENFLYAKDSFRSDYVASRIEKIFRSVLKSNK